MSDPTEAGETRGWVNAGELVVVAGAGATNGEIVGSSANDDAPLVSTVRVGTLGNLRDRSSAASSNFSCTKGCRW